ncbi:MAG: hypothetical protein ACLFMX_03105 [Halobacteriales archaeon]
MSLDVDPPAPPDLTNRGPPEGYDLEEGTTAVGEFRRAELEEVLLDGAWNEAFREWAAYTDLTDEQYERAREANLIDDLDLYWDPTEERLRFDLPTLPPALAADSHLATVLRVELSDLGDTLVDIAERGYLDWGDGEPIDTWTEAHFEEELPPEE